MASTRRLAAIMAADVAGYSRLMGADEEGTLARLKVHLGELVEPTIREHRGRIVKTTGDGLLAEFGSVVDAVRCADEVQRGMAERNAGVLAGERIDFRIGVNVGDILFEDGDIFGDGVNVAARLEGLAEPGGICVSARVQEDTTGKLDLAFRDLGEQRLRNIERPVRVYALSRPASSAASGPAVPVQGPIAPRLSIVVLPFANLSNDPDQDYFADGVTDDLTTDLSRIEHMLVISRSTAFTYKGKTVNAKEIGRELGVRYVLEGSVRKLGSRIRVNAQLIDAESNAHLWAERFDNDIADLFALQDEITIRIAHQVGGELIAAEAARPTTNPDALDYILRANAAYLKPPSREAQTEPIGFFEKALALDPGSVGAQSGLAIVLTARVMNGWADTPVADIARAERLTEQALAAAPASPLAHVAKGQVRRAQHRYGDALREYEAALAVNPNWVFLLYNVGQCKLYTGEIDEVIPLEEKALRLSPRDRLVA
jgi:adenylate cyclase